MLVSACVVSLPCPAQLRSHPNRLRWDDPQWLLSCCLTPPTLPCPQIGTGEATCKGCGYEYSPKRGDPEYPVAPGTTFQVCCYLPVFVLWPFFLRIFYTLDIGAPNQRSG